MIRVLLPLMLFLILVIFLGIGLHRDPRIVPSPLIGKPLPVFSLPTLHDSTQLLSNATLTGQPALLNVWASWCTPCLQEHPFLMQLSSENILPIYGLNYKDEAAAALKILQHHGNPFTAVFQDKQGKVSIDLGVYGAPETFLISADGHILEKHVGVLNADVWREKFQPLLKSDKG